MISKKKSGKRKILRQIFCYPNFFSANILFDPNFFWSNFFFTKFFVILYLESGTLDLEFRIWGLGSVTWNPVFGIVDLGLRIRDLDSSWPTDPFDQFGVAQLSKIFLQIVQDW